MRKSRRRREVGLMVGDDDVQTESGGHTQIRHYDYKILILKKNLRLLTPNRAIQMKYLIWK